MFAASKTGAVTGAPLDAKFNYVTMLLHGDGTNGAQNNTFLDSSTNNFTITRNGNTTQGSFSPYGSNWSNYFDGSSAYLSFANNANLNLGSGDFTLECWICPNTASGAKIIWSQWNNGGDNATQLLQNGTALIYRIGATQWTFGSGTLAAGVWAHIAVSRSGSTVRMFVNGAVSSTQTDSTNVTTTGATVIGANDTGATPANFFSGYISNLRQVKGTAVYTAAFTPPTAPLTAITNTQLLTCSLNCFKDASSNAYTPTVGGTPSVQRFNPFGTSTAYSTATIGGSGYFDGTGDTLATPSSSGFTFGTGDFTIETWINWSQLANAPSSEPGVFQTSTTSGGFQTTYTSGVLLAVFGGNYNVVCGTDYSGRLTSSYAVKFNTWDHVAIVRSSGTLTIYVNGVSAGSQSNSSNITATYAGIGSYYSSSYAMNGYISNFRVVKGTAVYTSAFTPPTAPLTAISGTQLLLSTTNAAIVDNSMMNDLETVGNAQISTSVKKYGTGSLKFDGTGDYLLAANGPNFTLGNAWTIETWIYPTSLPNSGHGICGRWYDTVANGNYIFYVTTSGELVGGVYPNFNQVSASGVISTNTWTHVAMTWDGTTLRLFANGVVVKTDTNNHSITAATTTPFSIGANSNGTGPWYGYIDDLRITKGYARYTSTFTPPTAAFPNIGPN